MKSLELRWGLIIGAANLLWLYGSYYLGMHTSGLALVQVMALIGILIALAGYIFALRAVQRAQPEIKFLEGVKSGAMISGIVAVIAVLAQVGYFQFVNPDWPDYMASESAKFFSQQGVEGEELEAIVEESRKTFSLKSYALQSAIGSIFFGVVFSLIIMAFLTRGRKG